MALFTHEQALSAGYSVRQVQRRRETGRWEQMHPGVYRVAGSPASWEQRLFAACLAAGRGAVVSHRSAAHLWGLDQSRRPLVELSVPPGRQPRVDGVIVHRSGDLTPAVCTVRNGIAVTTPLRTILDLGAVQGPRAVERCLEVALGRQLVTLAGLRAILDSGARRGRQGAGILRRLLEVRSDGEDLAESVLEARMLGLCRDQGLPQPVCQHEVRSGPRLVGRIDFAYPDDRVAIEVDGYEFHASLDAFHHDRARQNELVARGWTVLRFTWGDVMHHPARVARVVRDVLCALSNTGC
jgi:hypothetical protein